MTMDGLKLYLQQSPNCLIQSRHYNGWTHDHYVTNISGFCPTGTVVVACMNVPGCIHDSMVCEWENIYSQLEKVHEETGGTCTVDSAFFKKKCNFLIKSSQALPECAEEIVVNAEAIAMQIGSQICATRPKFGIWYFGNAPILRILRERGLCETN